MTAFRFHACFVSALAVACAGFCRDPAEAATRFVERIEVFSVTGTAVSTQTVVMDVGKRREETTMPSLSRTPFPIIEIRRDDLKVKWTIDPSKKRYAEESLESSAESHLSSAAVTTGAPVATSSTPVSSINHPFPYCDLQISTKVIAPIAITKASEASCQSFRIHADVNCNDKQTGSELWRYRVREELCVSRSPDTKGLPSAGPQDFETGAIVFAAIPPQAVQGVKGFNNMFAVFAESWKSIVWTMALINETQNGISGQPTRRVISWAAINNGQPVSLKDQETAYAVSQVNGMSGAGVPPINLSAFLAGLGASSLTAMGEKAQRSSAAKNATHREVPAWVLDVDSEFANHGGKAERRELVEASSDDRSDLFDLPKGYKKIKIEKLLQ